MEVLGTIPQKTLKLYYHALQSLIFNAMLSFKVKHFGLEPQLGDLVHVLPGEEHLIDVKPEIASNPSNSQSSSQTKEEPTSATDLFGGDDDDKNEGAADGDDVNALDLFGDDDAEDDVNALDLFGGDGEGQDDDED